MRLIYKYLGVLFFLPVFFLNAQVQVQLVDENQLGLPAANVMLLPDSTRLSTDLDGKFIINPNEVNAVFVTYVGFKDTLVRIQNSKPLRIQLKPSSDLLDEVVIIEEHAKQELSLAHIHLDEAFFQQQNNNTLANALDALPGLNVMNVGTGIAKPVIRGFYGNRVLVSENGVKQEGQQWGTDHGLEIDPFNVQRVEIIKGPASLQYGSDAVGGVINIMQKKIPQTNSFSGNVSALYKSNNNQWAGSAEVRGNLNDFFISARYTRQGFGDFSVPATEFEYNTFTLPIFDEHLKNTAGEEEAISITAGYKSKNSISKLTYSNYQIRAGIFPGAIGIPRTYTLQADGDRRNIELPFQSVNHTKCLFNQTFIFGEDHWVTNIGYQQNTREEHSIPEFHSVQLSSLEQGESLGIGLRLTTWSVNSHYEKHFSETWNAVLGGNAQWQNNETTGYDFLLPDYNTFRTGLFGILKWKVNPKLNLSGGARINYGTNENTAFLRYIYSSDERILDSLSVDASEREFVDYALALGGNYAWKENQEIKFNLARSFRIPYPNETVSNGVHHGTFQHEVGDPNLRSESGYQLDVSWNLRLPQWTFGLSSYANYMVDYIYLRPAARFSRLPEAGQLFQFTQNNAFFTGFELDWSCEYKQWTYIGNFEYLYSVNLDENLPLPFTPPNTLYQAFGWKPFKKSWFKNLYLEVNHEWAFAQNRVDRNERQTPAYHIFGFQVQQSFPIKNHQLTLIIEGQNVFNTFYLHHLSRYRLLNLPEQGQNFVFRVNYEW